MRAIQFSTIGLPAEVLQLTDIPLPEPQAGEVRIRVLARPINPSDIMFIRGLYGIRPHLPSGAGFEGMGEIEAHGSGVDAKRLPLGTRVSFTCTSGTWQEYAIAEARSVLPLLPDISDETGCQIFVNPFTAWAMIHETGLREGDWLLQTAGGSAFGQMVIQLAAMRGIKTISTVRRPDQIEQLTALGADAVVNLADENLPKRVKEITGGKGVTKAFDAVSGATGAEVLKSLSYGGTMYCYGSLSIEEMPVNSGLLIFKSLVVKGFWLTDWLKNTDAITRKHVATTLLELFAKSKMKAPVEAAYDLSDFKQAVEHADKPGRTGKILLIG